MMKCGVLLDWCATVRHRVPHFKIRMGYMQKVWILGGMMANLASICRSFGDEHWPHQCQQRLDESAGTAPWPARFSLESWTSWPNDMTFDGQNGLDIKIDKSNLFVLAFPPAWDGSSITEVVEELGAVQPVLHAAGRSEVRHVAQRHASLDTWARTWVCDGLWVGFLVLDVCESVGVLDDMLATRFHHQYMLRYIVIGRKYWGSDYPRRNLKTCTKTCTPRPRI